MTTTRENLESFAKGNENRGKFLTTLFDMVLKIATEVEDADTATLAAQAAADIALWDSENEQKEIANLIAVANSDAFGHMDKAEAVNRVRIMLGLDS